ncbi:MAG: bifunctional adenosylcobinamide kinase/adenosylcobinamide-phosphate guanylyltransferase [Lachnospiraceae bacterium]|nr:bifunctional adenosylcobinamide kinase/adenosylcobinamide-phosphate guanylyltransferase [Lachnospiraceae bacterium]
MILITGALYSGKREYAHENYGVSEEDLGKSCVFEAQELVRDPEKYPDLSVLCGQLSKMKVVTVSETGAGVVPVGIDEREYRERAGVLSQMLAKEAETVVRMICGIPQIIKDTNR